MASSSPPPNDPLQVVDDHPGDAPRLATPCSRSIASDHSQLKIPSGPSTAGPGDHGELGTNPHQSPSVGQAEQAAPYSGDLPSETTKMPAVEIISGLDLLSNQARPTYLAATLPPPAPPTLPPPPQTPPTPAAASLTGSSTNPELQAKLQHQGYRRWIQVGIGLLKVKGSLKPFIEDILRCFHQSIVSKISHLPVCTCTNKQIDLRNKCMKSPCDACRSLIQDTLAQHRHANAPQKIDLKHNKNICQWRDDFWAVAKLYAGYGLDSTNQGPEDTDIGSLLVIMNTCKVFESVIANTSLIDMVRHCRNTLMHSADMTCSKSDMYRHFNDMAALLSDKKLKRKLDPQGVKDLMAIRDSTCELLPSRELEELGDKPGGVSPTGVDVMRLLADLANKVELQSRSLEEYKKTFEKFQATPKDLPANPVSSVLEDLREELYEKYFSRSEVTRPIPWIPCEIPLQDVFEEMTLKDNSAKYMFGRSKSERRSYQLEDLFQPGGKGRRPKTVLIEGGPGIGKSTLCHHLSYKWAQNVVSTLGEPSCHTYAQTTQKGNAQISSINDFDVLLFIPVRDITEGDIFENICTSLLDDCWHDKRDQLKNCLMSCSERVVIFLDGYDECAGHQKDCVKNLVEQRILRGSTIILTSRPGFCTSSFDMYYDMDGFSAKSQRMYLDRLYTRCDIDESKRSALLQRLGERNVIKELCRNPLFLVLMCVLGGDGDGNLPDTQTQLYEEFVYFICEKAKGRHNFSDEDIACMQSMMEEVAFALHGDQQTPGASNSTSSTGGSLKMNELCQLGFICQEKRRNGLRLNTLGVFIHNSFADFFAAKHLIKLGKEQRIAFLDRNINRNTMLNVFVFMAGFSKEENHEGILEELMLAWSRTSHTPKLNDESLHVDDFLRNLSQFPNHTFFFHEQVHAPVHWMAEVPVGHPSVTLTCVDLFMETGEFWHTLVCNSYCTNGFINLLQILHTYKGSLVGQRRLHLGLHNIHGRLEVVCDILRHAFKARCISRITLSYTDANNYYNLAASFHISDPPEHLALEPGRTIRNMHDIIIALGPNIRTFTWRSMDHNQLQPVLQALVKSEQLKMLHLGSTIISLPTECVETLVDIVTTCTQLDECAIHQCTEHISIAPVLAKLRRRQMRHLNISVCDGGEFRELIKILDEGNQYTVGMVNSSVSNTFPILVQSLARNTCLQRLVFHILDYRDVDLVTLFVALKQFPNLRTLHLPRMSLSLDQCQVLANTLAHLPSLDDLWVQMFEMKGLDILSSGFHNVPELQRLVVWAVGPTAVSAESLLDDSGHDRLEDAPGDWVGRETQFELCSHLGAGLSQLPKLQRLELCDETKTYWDVGYAMSVMGSLAARAKLRELRFDGVLNDDNVDLLIQALKDNPAVRCIRLKNNNLSPSSEARLQACCQACFIMWILGDVSYSDTSSSYFRYPAK